MKSYTDIEQSKKLAEFLPIESADMLWEQHGAESCVTIKPWTTIGKSIECHCLGCWSLAALFDLIPSKIYDNNGNYAYLWVHKDIDEQQNKDKHYLEYHDPYDDFEHIETSKYDNFVDACYEMILKLNELKMM